MSKYSPRKIHQTFGWFHLLMNSFFNSIFQSKWTWFSNHSLTVNFIVIFILYKLRKNIFLILHKLSKNLSDQENGCVFFHQSRFLRCFYASYQIMKSLQFPQFKNFRNSITLGSLISTEQSPYRRHTHIQHIQPKKKL